MGLTVTTKVGDTLSLFSRFPTCESCFEIVSARVSITLDPFVRSTDQPVFLLTGQFLSFWWSFRHDSRNRYCVRDIRESCRVETVKWHPAASSSGYRETNHYSHKKINFSREKRYSNWIPLVSEFSGMTIYLSIHSFLFVFGSMLFNIDDRDWCVMGRIVVLVLGISVFMFESRFWIKKLKVRILCIPC